MGERPAGAVNGVFEIAVFSLEAGERAVRILRGLAEGIDLSVEKSDGEGGAFVRKKLVGFCGTSMEEPQGDLSFLGKKRGSLFSMSSEVSNERVDALRLAGEERLESARGIIVRNWCVW